MSKRQRRKTKEMKKCKPVPYTKKEREKKLTAIYFQLMQIDMFDVLTDEVRQYLKSFVNDGIDYNTVIELPEYSRVMVINFVNDKKMDSKNGIHLKFKKIRVEDKGTENPINILNKLQEDMIGL